MVSRVLRALVAALLVANLAFWAYGQGWLDGLLGLRSIGDREPERMARQVHPELIRVLPAGDAASSPSSSSSAPSSAAPQSSATSLAPPTAQPVACFEAGPFNSDIEFAAAQSSAQAALPGATLADVKADKPGSWMIYMGRYADRDALLKKVEELKRRRLTYYELRQPPSLVPGLSLGRFDDRSAADKALGQLVQQNIHTARIIELVPASSARLLRLETSDTALATQAASLRFGAAGKGFANCAKP